MAMGYAYDVLGDKHLAEDAVQEAFVAAYMSLSQLHTPEAFPAWFRRVIFTQCDRLTRGKQILTVPFEEAELMAPHSPSPDELAAVAELKRSVREAIDELPDTQKAVTERFYIDGHSQQEIAEALQISVATVKNRLRESRRHLKERMYEMADEVLAEERVALSIRSVVPLLTVYDVHRSIAFYRDVLGFEVEATFEWRGGFGWASLCRDHITLMLNAAVAPDARSPDGDTERSKDVTFYVGASNVDQVRRKFIEDGRNVGDLYETYYGMRQFALFDPDGYKLVLQEPTHGTRVRGAKSGTA